MKNLKYPSVDISKYRVNNHSVCVSIAYLVAEIVVSFLLVLVINTLANISSEY